MRNVQVRTECSEFKLGGWSGEMAVGVEPKVALVYDDDAYVEAGGGTPGLMGRQVAGRSFLEAYLSHGTFSELAALVGPRASTQC